MSLPTIADLKRHNNQLSSADDDELVHHLDAAVELVEGLIGPISAPGTVVETHRNVYSDVLVLRSMPVGSLTSVSSRSGSTLTALTLADYELEAASGLLRRADGGGFSGSYTVTYTSGRDALPASIFLAVLIVAAHLWSTQRGQAPSPLAVQDGEFDQPTAGAGYAIPNRARDLLMPYMMPSIA